MTAQHDNLTELSRQLNEYLKTKLGDEVSIDGELTRLQGGYDTDTYSLALNNAPSDIPAKLVLRLFRHARESMRVIRESTIQKAASSAGHPVPNVPIDSTGELLIDRPFILMERLPGSSMGELILGDPGFAQKFPALMARLQAGVLRLDSTGLRRKLEESDIDLTHMSPSRMIDRISAIAGASEQSELLALRDWLVDNFPDQPENPAVCHGDFHPNNILMDDGKVTGLIDWATTMFTHPEYDIAVTRTILSIGPPEDVGIPKEELNKLLQWAVGEYMNESHALQELDDELIDYYSVLRVGHAYAKVIGKRHNVELPYVAHDGYAWDRPDLFRVVTKIIGETTGITVASQ
jgi:aminoglycoside phosphotransferase (APT) family kinase protein